MSAKPPAPSGRAPSRRRRLAVRALLGTALFLALLAAGHALLWRWMGSQLQDGFAAWAAGRRAGGSHGPPASLGHGVWPFSATLTLPQFRLSGGEATLPGGMDWQAESLMLRVSLPLVDRLVVEMPGRHRLRLGGLEIPLAADHLAVELPIERNVLPREAALEGERLRFGIGPGGVEALRIRLGLETRVTAIEGEAAVTLRGGAEGLLLPASPMLAALGRMVQSLEFDAALTGPVPPGRGPAGRAEAWRDGGGTLALHGLELHWGPVVANTTATLTLDEALQPMGAGTLRLAGAVEALDAAAAAGLLSQRGAGTARTVVHLLSRVP
ncbi:MAG: DUF2125 domain-containing protein, partial [Acetobacteraceae bacterium]